MKDPREHILVTALLLCAVLSAFYLRAASARRASDIPVERVFVTVSASPAPLGYSQRREEQRGQEMAALSALAGEDAAAATLLREMVETAESERAVENTLRAMGYGQTVCAIRRGAATLCVSGAVSAAQAQTLVQVCAHLTGISEDQVFILDECAYL